MDKGMKGTIMLCSSDLIRCESTNSSRPAQLVMLLSGNFLRSLSSRLTKNRIFQSTFRGRFRRFQKVTEERGRDNLTSSLESVSRSLF